MKMERSLKTANHYRMRFLSFVTILLIGAGCNKTAPTTAAVSPAPPPTAFFAWCEKSNFGVDSPQSKQTKVGTTNIPGTPIGNMEFEAWTKTATAKEAQAFLAVVERDLRRAAQERGVEVDASPDGSSGGFTIKYRANRIRGTLTGAMELRDNKEGGLTVKRYFVRLSLIEVAAEP